MKKDKKLLKKAVICTLAASMLFSLTGCSSKDGENGTIAVITMSQQDKFWDYIKLGAEDAGKELGYNISYNAPEDATQLDVQIDFINQAVKDKAKAIVIAPIDANGLNDALQKADEAGVKIITIDSDVTYAGRETFIASNSASASAIAGRETAAMLGNDVKSAKVAIIGYSQGAAARIDSFKTIMENSGANVAFTEYCDESMDKAKEQTLEIIENNPDLKVMYGTNATSTIGICKAVEEAGKSGEVKVIGFDCTDEELTYIKNGTLTGTIVQNPYNIGYLGVRSSNKVIMGEYVSGAIDTGVVFVTQENVNDDDIQLIINPDK